MSIENTFPSVKSSTMTFAEAVVTVSAIAHAKLPEALHSRLEMATALVTHGAVWIEDDGAHAWVRSRSQQGTWHGVNGTCDCQDAHFQALDGLCAHRLAVGLARRAMERMRDVPQAPASILEPASPMPTIPADGLTMIQGKPFVKFAALLHLAHQAGLVRLETTIVQCSEVLAICQATATFNDGRVFTDIGDATERNVAKHLAPHFIRMAGTRASARALRRALDISTCAVEEMGDGPHAE